MDTAVKVGVLLYTCICPRLRLHIQVHKIPLDGHSSAAYDMPRTCLMILLIGSRTSIQANQKDNTS
jgi:hypothetical protein